VTVWASADLWDDESALAAPPPKPQSVAASRSPVITFTSRTTPVSIVLHHLLSFLIMFPLRQPSETGKQLRSGTRQALSPDNFHKSSQSRSRDVTRVRLPSPVQQQQHVKLGGASSEAINEANRATLALLAQVAELKRQNSVLVRGKELLEAENKRLDSENKRLDSENKSLESENKRIGSENKRLASEVQASVRLFEQSKIGLSPSKRHSSNSRHTRSGLAPANNSVAGPSRVISLSTQMERDEQDRHRHGSKEAAANIVRRRFQCQICLEEHKEAMVVRIDSCGHRYCRECITSYVGNKLDAKRFPILCPVCAAEPRKDKPGSV
jgi:hypothetical protein